MEKFLLCKPTFFDVKYSINPWMSGEKVDLRLALQQWENLCKQITSLGGVDETINPVKDLYDMVFTANCGITSDPRGFVNTINYQRWYL